jgi:hypothetical protein
MGLKPRIISKNLTTFLSMAAKRDICLLCLNQLRNIMKVMPGQDPFISPGGNAIPFLASVRLRVKSIGKLKIDEEVIGVKTEVTVQKTRFGPPFGKTTFPIYFTHGVDDTESIIDTLESRKAVTTFNAGSKGKMIQLEGQKKEDAVKKSEFKQQFIKDQAFRNTILDIFEKTMTKDLADPRFTDAEISNE